MAEFILGSPLRKLARRHHWLRRALWRIDYGFVWLVIALFRLLPIDFASRLGATFGGIIGPLLRSKHALLKENLAIAFPQLDAAALDDLARRAWRQGGRILAEYPHLAKFADNPARLEIDTSAVDVAALQPCVVVTAHLSSWEVVGSAMTTLDMPNATLYSPPSNPHLNQMLLDSRAVLNCELVPRDNSARQLLRALKRGRSIGVVMDRRVDEGAPMSFFGHPKNSTTMPAKLALKHGCAMVPARVERIQNARYRVTFLPPITPDDPSADERTQAENMTQQVHMLFEEWISANPEDWLCSKRLWPRGTIGGMHTATNDNTDNSHAV